MTWFHSVITFLWIICIWCMYASPFQTDHMENSMSALGIRNTQWLTMDSAICAADEQSWEIKGITWLFHCPYFVLWWCFAKDKGVKQNKKSQTSKEEKWQSVFQNSIKEGRLFIIWTLKAWGLNDFLKIKLRVLVPQESQIVFNKYETMQLMAIGFIIKFDLTVIV